MTQADCRRRAAQFYLTSITGIVDDWIESGLDKDAGVDKDIKDCADMLWDVAKQATKTGVSLDAVTT